MQKAQYHWGSNETRVQFLLLHFLPSTQHTPYNESLQGHHCWTRHSPCLLILRTASCSLGKLLKHELLFSTCKMERVEKIPFPRCLGVKAGIWNKWGQGHPVARAKRVLGGVWPHIAMSSLYGTLITNSFGLQKGPGPSLQLQ